MDVVEFVDGSVRITVEDLLFVVADFSDGVGFDFFRFLFLLCFLLSIIQIRMNTTRKMDRSIFSQCDKRKKIFLIIPEQGYVVYDSVFVPLFMVKAVVGKAGVALSLPVLL